MKQYWSGILKKNSRGRGYLVYVNSTGIRKIFALIGGLDGAGNGERVIVFGVKDGKKIHVMELMPWPYPRKKALREERKRAS